MGEEGRGTGRGGRKREGTSLLECVVSASLLAVLFSVAAASLLVSQRVIKREEKRQEGLMVAFKVAQTLLTFPFDHLPPEKFSGKGGLLTLKLSFPPLDEKIQAFDEKGKEISVRFEGGREVKVHLDQPLSLFIQYTASWEEKGWKVKVWGEFVDEGLRRSETPTDLKGVFVQVEKDDLICPTLWFLRGR